jgi:hypothetical protein
MKLENNIKINLREIGWGGMDWIDLAQDRDQWAAPVNTVIKLPSSRKCYLGDWRLLKKDSAP